MSKLEPRIRGRACRCDGVWIWEALLTLEPIKVLQELPGIDAQLVEEPEVLTVKSTKSFDTKEAAQNDLRREVPNIIKILNKTLNEAGINTSGMIDMKSGQFYPEGA